MKKIEVILQTIKKYNLDGLLISSDQNRLWFTNFNSSAGYLFFNSKGESILLIDGRYFVDAKETLSNKISKIILLDVSKKTLKEYFVDILQELNISKLGIEAEYTNLHMFEFYKSIPNINLLSFPAVSLRRVKEKQEIEYLQKAADIAAETIEWIKTQIQPGMTEIFVANMISKHMLDLGATKNSFDPIVASGINGANPHHKPSDKKIEMGDMITVDIGCIYKGYCSDITRSFILGNTPNNPEMIDIYNVVYESQKAGIEATSNKMSGADIDKVCRDIISKTKYKDFFVHSTGHGVGIEVHEEPNVSFNNKQQLDNFNVITIEPGVYVPNIGGVRIEDTIVVIDDEALVLTRKASKEIFTKK